MIVLDTHIWVWWVHGDSRLSNSHAELTQDHENDEIGICTISLWEVANAIESTQLPGAFHRDPADQIIVATSRIHASDLVTADQRIRDYPHVNTP